ncbi:hypothetical protein [Thermococcus sp.]
MGLINIDGKRKIQLDPTTSEVKILDENDAEVMNIESHATRHAFGGEDAIPEGSLDFTQMITDTIQVKIPVLIPDSVQDGLAADSTGVKWTSAFKFRIPKRHLKNIVLRASWTASATDSVEEIDLIDAASGSTVCSVSGNAGTDVESINFNSANLTDDGLVYVQAQVTTASATAGATFSIGYIVVEIRLGIS